MHHQGFKCNTFIHDTVALQCLRDSVSTPMFLGVGHHLKSITHHFHVFVYTFTMNVYTPQAPFCAYFSFKEMNTIAHQNLWNLAFCLCLWGSSMQMCDAITQSSLLLLDWCHVSISQFTCSSASSEWTLGELECFTLNSVPGNIIICANE